MIWIRYVYVYVYTHQIAPQVHGEVSICYFGSKLLTYGKRCTGCTRFKLLPGRFVVLQHRRQFVGTIHELIWVNYNISLTWIKAIWGWFPLLTMIPVRSQWGRYNLPRTYMLESPRHSGLFMGAASGLWSPIYCSPEIKQRFGHGCPCNSHDSSDVATWGHNYLAIDIKI